MILDYIYRCVDVPGFSFIYVSYTLSNTNTFPFENLVNSQTEELHKLIRKTQIYHIPATYIRPFINAHVNIQQFFLVGWELAFKKKKSTFT